MGIIRIEKIIAELEVLAEHCLKEKNYSYFNIAHGKAFGIPMPQLRELRKKHGKQHQLGLELWQSEYHEAKLLAAMFVIPNKMQPHELHSWVNDFYAWDICDNTCGEVCSYYSNIIPFIHEWITLEGEYQRRAGYATIAYLATKSRKTPNDILLKLIPLAGLHLNDDRTYVKKSISWALRQIGKSNIELHEAVNTFCQQYSGNNQPSTECNIPWVINDTLKEINSKKVLKRLSI